MKQLRFFIVSAFIAMSAPLATVCANTQNSDSTTTDIPKYEVVGEPEWHKYIPTISGTVRSKFEWQPQIGASRFEVRNARIGVSGNVLTNIGYKAEIDFCDEGKIKVLDVYGKITLFKNQLGLTLGQMRLPFSVDAKRGPHMLYFANRSFLSKQLGNVRDVGVMFSYHPAKTNLNIEAGIFNGNGLTNQTPWNDAFIYAARVNYNIKGVKAEVGFLSQRPDKIRINLFDVSLSWTFNNLFIEGEYMNKHYTGGAFKTAHGYNVMANYTFPMRKIFHHISVQGRFDGMTDQSNGVRNEEGKLELTHYGRNRLTGGVTFSFLKKIGADIRLNYEKYFYHDENAVIGDSDHDKFVAELVIRF